MTSIPFLSEPLSIETVLIKIAELPDRLNGIKIVQLSDFHYDGLLLSDDLLNQAIEATNRVEPDLIVLTGDYVTHTPKPIDQLAHHLRRLQSRAGVYAVLGNHDLELPDSKTKIRNALTDVGIDVLWNQVVYPFGEDFAIVGLPDFWSSEFAPASVFDQIDSTIPRVVLSHNPDSAIDLNRWRVDLQLSGHTHGGQIVIPGVGAVPTWIQASRGRIPKPLWKWTPFLDAKWPKVVNHWQWAQGLHSVGENQLYVNRGLGTFPPGRWNCPPEVTVFSLIAKRIRND
ncbi:MAG: metallophosphoesterase [Leptolyngbya sp. Prado105]|nr:metallophosphoesterase [Leptolyngbya sp. Prado105]